jgi:hypothetical protein
VKVPPHRPFRERKVIALKTGASLENAVLLVILDQATADAHSPIAARNCNASTSAFRLVSDTSTVQMAVNEFEAAKVAIGLRIVLSRVTQFDVADEYA